MNKISFMALRFISGVMLLTASLPAEELSEAVQPIQEVTEVQIQEPLKNPSDRLPVGTRKVSVEESNAILEEQVLAKKTGEFKNFSEKQNKPHKEGSFSDLKKALAAKASSEFLPYGSTYHAGVLHHPFAVFDFGTRVQLEDGSIWIVHPGDTYKTLNWLTSDLVLITANHSWNAGDRYMLNNENTGVSVRVNLEERPIYFPHWIIAIDLNTTRVQIEDGTIWDMSTDDRYIVRNWRINENVIIGINNGWLSQWRPNILINVETLDHARCSYYK